MKTPPRITLRPASLEDSDALLSWRNDPETRANSLNSGFVAAKDHAAWLAKMVVDPRRRLFIAEWTGKPVGTARADQMKGSYELSWTVAPEFRGRGLGKAIVKAAIETLPGPVTARIKADNEPSRRIALSAGMRLVREDAGVQEWST